MKDSGKAGLRQAQRSERRVKNEDSKPLIHHSAFCALHFSCKFLRRKHSSVKAASLPSRAHTFEVTQRRCVMKTQRSFARGWQLFALTALVAAVVVASLAARGPRTAHAQGQKSQVASSKPAPSATPTA